MTTYRTPDSFKVVPRHIAIIMDGNGRWARRKAWKRIRGHDQGVNTVRTITEAASALGLEQLTLYALSTENWRVRPKPEVDFLMSLLKTFVVKEQGTMMRNNIRMITIGHIEEFSADVQEAIASTVEMTRNNTGTVLCLALNYGSRRELVDMTKSIAAKVKSGELDPEAIDDATVAAHLYQPDMPEPDLLIRTAQEMRISNFLLWQISYAEIWVTDRLWPEFTQEDLYAAVTDFGKRERRYGGLENLNKV